MPDTSGPPTGRLKDALSLDSILLGEDIDAGLALGSPLQRMSPESLASAKLGLGAGAPAAADPDRIGARFPNRPGSCPTDDALAPLPSFRKRKPDPRRQSTAIFSAFEATTSGAGLLGDSELAVGDEDQELLIPLAKSSAAMAAKGVSSLWVDPDTDDALLEEALPEPSLAELVAQARAASVAAAPAGGIGVRDSVALFEGFSLACEGSLGLDAVNEEDALFSLSPMAPAAAAPATATAPPASDPAAAPVPEPKKPERKSAVAVPPPRKPSRLKPPSSSSSFFTQTTAKATSAPSSSVPRPRPPSQAPKAKLPLPPPQKPAAVAAPKPAPRPAPRTAPKSAPLPAPQPAEKKTAAAQPRQPAPSRLPRSRLPAPKPVVAAAPAPAPTLNPRPVKTQVTQLRKPQPPPAAPAAASTPAPSAVPPPDAAADTPRTAHLRWLEAHPELAFGGGAKIANTPGEDDEPKKKTAEERHYEAWGKAVTPL